MHDQVCHCCQKVLENAALKADEGDLQKLVPLPRGVSVIPRVEMIPRYGSPRTLASAADPIAKEIFGEDLA